MTYVVSSPGYKQLPTPSGVDGDAFLTLFGGRVRSSFKWRPWFSGDWDNGFVNANLQGGKETTEEYVSDLTGGEWVKGTNVDVDAEDNGLVDEQKDGNYLVRTDKALLTNGFVEEFDIIHSSDLFVQRGMKMADSIAQNLARKVALRKCFTLLANSSLPDPAFGGGKITKTQASNSVNGAFPDANAAPFGCYLDSTLLTDGTAVELLVQRAKLYWDAFEAPEEGRKCYMRPQTMMLWMRSMGYKTGSTEVSKALDSNLGGGGGSMRKMQMFEHAGIMIMEMPLLAQLGTRYNGVFTAVAAAAAGDKYAAGTGGGTIPIIDGFTPSAGVFEMGQSGNNPTSWDTGSKRMRSLADQVVAIFWIDDACKTNHSIPITSRIRYVPGRHGYIYEGWMKHGHGAIAPQNSFYAVTGLAST